MIDMDIINLTPHAVAVGDRTFPPSEVVARVDVELTECGDIDGIPLVKGTYGNVTDLPKHNTSTFYIVSTMVRLACPDRTDLGSPSQLIRDETGRIVGCGALEMN